MAVNADPKTYNGDMSWLVEGRFGLFIHWGIYSVPARHEWVMSREQIHPDDYYEYFRRFDPDLYDPKVWARLAKGAGMKYFVVTTKHHDGFCLWDSKLTDYKAPNTPIKRDLIRPMVESFRAEGLKIGFYHSLIDWRHPDFPLDGLHPLREDAKARGENDKRDIERYTEYLHGQVRELLTEYGEIDYLWFDFSYPSRDWGWAKGKGPDDWRSEKLEALVRELQPEIVLNNRLGLGRGVQTPEQYQPRGDESDSEVFWEACQTMNGSWGYDRDNLDWKSTEMLLQMLIDSVSKGGNLLLNVGPNARGEFDEKSIDRLQEIGRWMRLHNRSIYGCGKSAYVAPPDCRYTQNENRLYLHLFSWPFKHVHLDGLAERVEFARFLHDGSEVKRSVQSSKDPHAYTTAAGGADALTLHLPVQKPGVGIPVVELLLKE